MQNDDKGKPTFRQILIASVIGFIIAALMHLRFRRCPKIVPHMKITDTGQIKLERFSHYVARQIGFVDRRECPQLCKLASDYARKSEGCDENIYAFFDTELDGVSLFIKLVEFERCIISYFALHWSHADLMISQVLGTEDPKKKLRSIVMAATRWGAFPLITDITEHHFTLSLPSFSALIFTSNMRTI